MATHSIPTVPHSKTRPPDDREIPVEPTYQSQDLQSVGHLSYGLKEATFFEHDFTVS
jgi:hypothetical protein